MTQSADIYGVADYLDLTVPTIRRRLKAGKFPQPIVEQDTEWWTIDQLVKYQANLRRQATRKRNRVG